jgi:hypothetical protein
VINGGRRFRFTIGQGMILIALLAVAFANMPMPLAINVAFATICLLAIGRKRLLFEPIGCVSCFLGLLTSVTAVEAWLLGSRTPGDKTLLLVFAGSMIVGLLGAARLRRPGLTLDKRARHGDETEIELDRVGHLLRCAQDDGDEIVISKLTEYRAKLEREQE